ncbi:hypothetical protein [Gordonia paraffinivorans]|uniref:hypothetical protein n=1 Tax=Gordonia paraffinivorans TaxID=175628 RepID=UPI003FCDD80A
MATEPITDEMLDQEIARLEAQRELGIYEVNGNVRVQSLTWGVFWAVLLGNLATAVVVGIVATVIYLLASA